jgi:hypothetical protein
LSVILHGVTWALVLIGLVGWFATTPIHGEGWGNPLFLQLVVLALKVVCPLGLLAGFAGIIARGSTVAWIGFLLNAAAFAYVVSCGAYH